MALFGLKTKASQTSQVSENLERFICDFSIEVMPRTAEKIVDFRDFHFKANSKSSLELQNCEKDIFNNYRGRWRLNE